MNYDQVGKEKNTGLTYADKQTATKMYTTCTVNIRAQQSITSEILHVIDAGQPVEVIENFGEWCMISFDDKEAYIMSEFITENEAE